MGNMNCKIHKVLDDNLFMKKNLKRFARLTKREKQIIALVAQGYSNPDISDLLFISRHTVEKHRKNIKSKVEIKNTAELIRFAIVFDLIE
jgi:DNA-binding CsgD family transcriptional regulator